MNSFLVQLKINNLLRIFIFIVFVCIGFTSYSQNSTSSNDSLLQANLQESHTYIDSIKAYIDVLGRVKNSKTELDELVRDVMLLIKTSTPDTLKITLYKRIGIQYAKINSVKKGLQYLGKGLKLAGANDDSIRIADIYYFLGRINYYQGDMTLANKYFIKNADYFPKGVVSEAKIRSLIALATINYKAKNYKNTDSLYSLSLRYTQRLEGRQNQLFQALIFNNFAQLKADLNQMDSAFYYVAKGKKINLEIDYKLGIAWSNFLEGELYSKEEQWKKADKSTRIAIDIWEDLNSYTDLAYGYKAYATIKGKLGEYKSAYIYNVKDQTVNDSIRKKENIKRIEELENRFQNERDSLNLANVKLQLKQEKLERSSEVKAANRRMWFFSFVGVILIINSIYFIYKFRVTKKAKSIIEEQHIALELKNKEITDSINYAKRIQNTIIPTRERLEKYLPASFVFYRPKDIVAGDFYWLEQVDDLTFCAVADCTGHGVPGAMVSVVCANALNKIILEKGEKEPGKILDRVRDIVIEQFHKSDEGINDGMDISLCVINFKTKKLRWSGANNPLWIIRDDQLIEKKGDKQPIGKYIHNKAFKSHTFQLHKNDIIYMFTDGFADQFGGEDGKKLKIKNFKKWILSVRHEPMDKQYEFTDEYFNEWKGTLEQLDDVCVMGVRLK